MKASQKALKLLENLYCNPVVPVAKVEKYAGSLWPTPMGSLSVSLRWASCAKSPGSHGIAFLPISLP